MFASRSLACYFGAISIAKFNFINSEKCILPLIDLGVQTGNFCNWVTHNQGPPGPITNKGEKGEKIEKILKHVYRQYDKKS